MRKKNEIYKEILWKAGVRKVFSGQAGWRAQRVPASSYVPCTAAAVWGVVCGLYIIQGQRSNIQYVCCARERSTCQTTFLPYSYYIHYTFINLSLKDLNERKTNQKQEQNKGKKKFSTRDFVERKRIKMRFLRYLWPEERELASLGLPGKRQ
ncbi:hypothetical protein PoB_000612400 [Plakobranchus ocellatus]|uniref:Uncharacterized protein n=1 Tax=Plakobranchus ocellatus TaxID=259542 RepID=A0AAV3Y9H6_9GAST|nr:hypothetical protein PoB_000612400 [Plakobranchus ocellatus]